MLVVNVSARHDKNGGSACVCNCLDVAIVSAFKYCGMGVPNNAQAVAAINEWDIYCFKNHDQFDVTAVAVSSLQDEDAELIEVRSKDNEVTENKLLHLCANNRISASQSQLFRLPGRTNLCIPVVHCRRPIILCTVQEYSWCA